MMEGGEGVLRQLIGQLQDLFHLYGSSSHHFSLQFHSQSAIHHQPRWCYLNSENNPIEQGCYNFKMTAGKSENLKMLEPGKPPTKKPRKDRNHGKSTAPTTSTETMEPHIWQEFPEDLFEAVIARLPIPTFFRFRSVCRKWNSLLTSQSFSQQCSQVKQTTPWFYTITHENMDTGTIYNPLSKKWHHLTIPSLPTKLIILPVASAGGLICFIDIGHRNFYTCNPLTKSFKVLPPRSVKVWSRVAVGMMLNQESGAKGYKILWVGCNGDYEVYESEKNLWARPGTMPSHIKLPLALNFRSQAVSINQTIYFMRSDPDGIVAYNTVTGAWKQFSIPAPPHLSDLTLAECGGRIMLAGLLTKNAATCVCIWELQKMTLLWKEVDRMPNIWCLEFYGKHVRMTCLGNKGLLMLSLRSRQMNRVVSYDLSSREWVKVPSCLMPIGRRRQWIACGTAFHPALSAIA